MDNLRVLYQSLEQEDYEILLAQSGEEALTTARDIKPELVLLDVQMPGMDGFETCRKLLETEGYAPKVIFLSADNTEEARKKGIEAGAVEYLTKPFKVGEVLAKVSSSLDR